MNILLITTDTQRTDTLHCMGNDFAHSPQLDRLASEGILFNQAHTSSPVCGPARSTLLTGLHAPVHGAIENGIPPRRDFTPFSDVLANGGYTNIMAGKTHFGPTPDSFHIRRATKGGKKPGAQGEYTANLRKHGYEPSDDHPHDIPEELFYDAFVTDQCIEGIKEARSRGDAPWFAFCSMISPHGPLDPPGKWGDLYKSSDLPLAPRNPDTSGEPEHTRRLLALDDRAPASEEHIDRARRLYYGLSAYCDHQVGRLIDFLETEGLRQDTLIIFTSDHGIDPYDHGFDNKHHWYDNTWRVPLIVSQPGTLASGETRDFAVWSDLTATILGAAGLDHPPVQGFDLYSALRAGDPSPRKCSVGTLYQSCALATQNWKLEYYGDNDQVRLFDRVTDPGEYTDLATNPSYAEVTQALRNALLTWRAALRDIEYLHSHSREEDSGGPVARRIRATTREMRGSDAEARLNDHAEAIDARFPTA